MKHTKYMAILLFLVIAATILVACNGDESTETEEETTTATTTVYTPGTNPGTRPLETTEAETTTTAAPVTTLTTAQITTAAPVVTDSRLKLANIIDDPTATYIATLNYTNRYTVAKDGSYTSAQGACSDGTYIYLSIKIGDDSLTKIHKVNPLTGAVIKISAPLALNHCNDMTYNSLTRQIIVCHNGDAKTKISFVDPETLTITGSKTLGFSIYGIDYDAVNNRYIIGISGSTSYRILDADFKNVKPLSGRDVGATHQGAYCDSKYIYLPQSNSECLAVFDWDGKYITTIMLNFGMEVETAFWFDDSLWIYFNNSGGQAIRVDISKKP